ncbi:hypothetical protein [Cellulomonas sp. P24]|uniref:hypothetical protein n=1 Tax=Cellulomonas sp. P24 TaxID=2885206 RepID=UPI00216B3A16|nr:hypothetical protein [Cellulomonas sp. P24]MCR6493743.1 hypothetical protein [Cellulomonas sp. P24]
MRSWFASDAARLRLVLAVVAVATFAIRFVPLVAAGMLRAEYGYDDGVHLSLAEHLIAGRLPYRDVLFVHPPGIVLALTPAAALARVVGDPWALAAGRLLVMTVGVLNAVLIARILRRRGLVAALVGGLGYAFWGPAIAAERSIYLEPFIGLGLLIAFAALARRHDAPARPDAPTSGSSTRDHRLAGTSGVLAGHGMRAGRGVLTEHSALAVAGIALGVAATFKVWVVLDLTVVGFLVLARHGVRGAVRWVGWVLVGLTPIVLPFAWAAPRAMWDDVVLAQIGRPRTAGLLHERLAELGPAGVAGVCVALVVLAAVALGIAGRRRRASGTTGSRRTGGLHMRPPSQWSDPAWWAVAGVVHLAALVGAPSYYLHYTAFLAPPACLLAGAAVGALSARARRSWGVVARRAGAGGLVLALAGLALTFPALPSGPREDRALLAALTRTGCTWSENPSYLLVADAQTRMIAEGCPGQPDLFGTVMTERGGYPVPGIVDPSESVAQMVARQVAASRTVLLPVGGPESWLAPVLGQDVSDGFTRVATTGGIAVWQRVGG